MYRNIILWGCEAADAIATASGPLASCVEVRAAVAVLLACVVALAGVRLVEQSETTVRLTCAVAAVVAAAATASYGLVAGCAEVRAAVTMLLACVVALAGVRRVERDETTVLLTRAVAAAVAAAAAASGGLVASCAEVRTTVTMFLAGVVALA